MALRLPQTVLLSPRHLLRTCLVATVVVIWTGFLVYCALFSRSTNEINIRAFAEQQVLVGFVRAPHVGTSPTPARRRSSGTRNNATDRPKVEEVLHGDYVVLQNVLSGLVAFGSDDSVTLTTHGTYEQLDNLLDLVRLWDGPLSVALYAPRDDFPATLRQLLWLRRCHLSVADRVTFHMVYPAPGAVIWVPDRPAWSEPNRTKGEAAKSIKRSTKSSGEDDGLPYDYLRMLHKVLDADAVDSAMPCDNIYPGTPHESGVTYRARHGLSLPINVCRNAARLTATTRYVLAADIELFPSVGVVDMFLDFIEREKNESGKSSGNGSDASAAVRRRVYVLPHFEVKPSVAVPPDKRTLAQMYRSGSAVDFHKYRMAMGHVIPRVKEWMDLPINEGRLDIFTVAKRELPFTRWEPFYIGTNDDPLYTELLTWEGQMNKLTQMYEICLMNYELAILDNAFLIHHPGIKRRNVTELKYRLPFIARNSKVYEKEVKVLETKHGMNPNCR